jgi:hypothetical protein
LYLEPILSRQKVFAICCRHFEKVRQKNRYAGLESGMTAFYGAQMRFRQTR